MARKNAGRWQQFFAEDPDFQRWYRNVARGSLATADNYRRKVGTFLSWAKMSPAEFAALSSKQHHELLSDFVDHEISRKVAGSTCDTIRKAVLSWLEYCDKPLAKKVKVPNASHRPRARKSKTPMQEELRRILNVADGRSRAAAGLIAFSGLRPEVLGNYLGDDGLRIHDLVDAEIRDGLVAFRQVPCMIVVPENLSKTDAPWHTFIGPEGCSYLEAHFRERVEKGEKLTPESPVIRPKKVNKPFMRTNSFGNLVRKPIRAAGVNAYPYLLRSYFDTRLLLAESKRLIVRDYRQFFMGHSGDIESDYTTDKQLPPDLIESMRAAYVKCLPYLETHGTAENADYMLDMVRLLLMSKGYTEQEIARLDLPSKTPKEVADLVSSKQPEPASSTQPKQRVIQPSELEAALQDGWAFRSELRDGRILLEAS